MLCANHLEHLGRRCWVVFDRLDEAFEHSRDLERIVLRGLMRTHLDVASYGSLIRTKLFLRNDIMDRITRQQGFVNATHLRRLNLQWDREGIIDLLARRIVSSEDVAKILKLRSIDLKSGLRRLHVCHRVYPTHIYNDGLLQWIHLFTTDATQELNPRNVLTLVRLAKQHQLAVYDRDDPKLTSVPCLISADAMINGFRALSEVRLEDTVYAEFNHLRPVVEALHGKPARFTSNELAHFINTGTKNPRLKSFIEALEYAGVVSVSPQSIITVARLYRPALNINLSRNSDVTLEEQEALQNTVNSMMSAWPEGDRSMELSDVSTSERKFIHQYVQARYPGYSTFSVSRGKLYDLKTLVIQKQSPDTSIKTLARRFRKQMAKDYDPKSIEILLGLRDDAAGVDEYFIAPSMGGLLALNLIEIDCKVRKNKARRRIIAVITRDLDLANLAKNGINLVLGPCHAKIIDPSREMHNLPAEIEEGAVELAKGLCNIAVREKSVVVVTLSCSAVKSIVINVADQYPNICLAEAMWGTGDPRPVVILQP